MKKFRMMLPVLAVIFAIAGAVGGDLLPITNGYYQVGIGCSSSPAPLNEDDCFVSSNTQLPICTVTVSGTDKDAFQNSDCSGILRHQ